jgi:hypothetical protein
MLYTYILIALRLWQEENFFGQNLKIFRYSSKVPLMIMTQIKSISFTACYCRVFSYQSSTNVIERKRSKTCKRIQIRKKRKYEHKDRHSLSIRRLVALKTATVTLQFPWTNIENSNSNLSLPIKRTFYYNSKPSWHESENSHSAFETAGRRTGCTTLPHLLTVRGLHGDTSDLLNMQSYGWCVRVYRNRC